MNIKFSLLFSITACSLVLLLMQPLRAAAFTAGTTGIPYVMDKFALHLSSHGEIQQDWTSDFLTPADNVYTATTTSAVQSSLLTAGHVSDYFYFSYDPQLYDYYVLGAYTMSGTLSPTYTKIGIYGVGNEDWTYLTDTHFVTFNGLNSTGYSFYGKIPDTIINSNIRYISLTASYAMNTFNVPSGTTINFTAQILPVLKSSGGSEAALDSLLAELTEINNNLLTVIANQQTHTSTMVSWWQQLIDKLDQIFINDYSDTSITDAGNTLSSEAAAYQEAEQVSFDKGTTAVNDFAASGYDSSVLESIAPGILFVTTWFTNFWNMGGVFTSMLTFLFGLFIVFTILRTRKG